ncbi:MAG: ADP-ribosylglycohydrolase family protein [Bacteroidetes bacterium]|nr:ADP-ribosylglycohydrolase family protein [Bacteroidota bacterium]
MIVLKKKIHLTVICCLVLSFLPHKNFSQERKISEDELKDKISGFWIGQLTGNYLGLPFENRYVEEPIPILIDRIYTYKDDASLKINRQDWRGYLPIMIDAFWGAFADDDTDIEFVTLHAVEQYGLDLNYAEITKEWKEHINRKIWVANRTARNLMDKGFVAPYTGHKENNKNWFQIDAQLVNEIWGVFYPGMTQLAVDRSLWGAKITNDDWGTHPTIAYGAMISAAFFESDPETLVKFAIDKLPKYGPFYEGVNDVLKWHKQHDDWRIVRKKIHDKYYSYENEKSKAPVSVVSSLNNGLVGIMAILYGNGDFMKTVGIAVSAGYDCDNQAATVGGLMGVIHGSKAIPDELTKKIPIYEEWSEPFNNIYINFTRDNLSVATPIDEIVMRIFNISKTAILENGGRIELDKGNVQSLKNSVIEANYKSYKTILKFGDFQDGEIIGGDFIEETGFSYVQDGNRVRILVDAQPNHQIFGKGLEGFYNGESIQFNQLIDNDIFWDDSYGKNVLIIDSDF